MRLTLSIDMDGAAFFPDDPGPEESGEGFDAGPELGRIFRALAEQAEGAQLMSADRIHDTNGNTVGTVEINDDDDANDNPDGRDVKWKADRIRDGLRQHAEGLERLAREIEEGS